MIYMKALIMSLTGRNDERERTAKISASGNANRSVRKNNASVTRKPSISFKVTSKRFIQVIYLTVAS